MHLLYSLSIRSVITGQCQHLKTVVLAEPVSSQVELTIFPVPDCKKPDSFQHSYTLHQDPLTERKRAAFYWKHDITANVYQSVGVDSVLLQMQYTGRKKTEKNP